MKTILLSTAVLHALVSALPAQTLVRVDFGIDSQTTAGPGWNNMRGPTAGPNPATPVTDLVDEAGEATGIDLAYSESGSNAGVSGSGGNYDGPYPPAIASLPQSALKDGFYYQKGNTVTLTLSNLDPGNSHDFLLYGARGNNGGETTYTATGANNGSGTISSVINNADEVVQIMGITPTAEGVITILLEDDGSGANAPTGSINMMQITLLAATDTDNDGMPDHYEDANELDKDTPADADQGADDGLFDNDGLTNLEEYKLGTNPNLADTDGDGLKDGEEVDGTRNPWTAGVFGTPPGDATDPRDDDSDDDGFEDGDEITNGTDPNLPPANTGPVFPFVDTDGDSYRDEAETAFGSSPSDPDSCPNHTPNPAKPNVVIIYADDMGLGDMSAYGALFGTPSPAITPRMDSLATEGTLFTQAHSSNAVCTPSRYALLTGKYNWREFNNISNEYGVGPISEIPRASDTTIAEFLKTMGYDTAAFGKWHLGGRWHYRNGNTRVTGNPNTPSTIDWARRVDNHAVDHGFDIFRGLACTINRGPYVYMHDDRNQFWDSTLNGGTGGFRNATNADPIQWISASMLSSSVVGNKASTASLGDPSYRQVDAGPFMITQLEEYIADRATAADPDPFLTYVALYSPHLPMALTPPFIGTDSANGFYHADWMREVDDRIGRVIDAIDTNGFRNNTIVILTSDNGPETVAMSQSLAHGRDPNGPLRGCKRDTWDGGTRVPFVVRWPGQAAAGMKVSELIWQGDIFATIAAYLGEELPTDVAPDGESFLNLIRGQQRPSPRREAIVVSSIRGDLGLKTSDGWKLIDSTGGGGNSSSWDSDNNSISSAAGTNQGAPKQLFHQAIDLGEDDNLISTLTNTTTIRSELVTLTGTDLLGTLDQLRTTSSSVVYPRVADNDADALPNSYELAYGLDPDSPKDATADLDGDGSSNHDEFIAGTDPNDPADYLHIVDLQNAPDTLTVTWPSITGRSYTVSWSVDMQAWTPDSTHPGTGGPIASPLDKAAIDAVDGVPGNLTQLFVRVGVTTVP